MCEFNSVSWGDGVPGGSVRQPYGSFPVIQLLLHIFLYSTEPLLCISISFFLSIRVSLFMYVWRRNILNGIVGRWVSFLLSVYLLGDYQQIFPNDFSFTFHSSIMLGFLILRLNLFGNPSCYLCISPRICLYPPFSH